MTDELARVIGDAQREWHDWLDPTVTLNEHVTSAVRSYLLSDERVEAAAVSMASEINFTFSAFGESARSKYLRQSRAAIAAAIGEDGP